MSPVPASSAEKKGRVSRRCGRLRQIGAHQFGHRSLRRRPSNPPQLGLVDDNLHYREPGHHQAKYPILREGFVHRVVFGKYFNQLVLHPITFGFGTQLSDNRRPIIIKELGEGARYTNVAVSFQLRPGDAACAKQKI